MTDPLALPLKLRPRLDRKPWGGDRLARFGFTLPNGDPVGEAVITAGEARVVEGDLAGASVQAVVDRDPERVVGVRGLAATGNRARFPLLIKLIDAGQDLSIQVHPTDETAPAGERGKTETYHVLASDPGSAIALGLLPGVSAATFAAACRAGAPTSDLLRWIPARAGESILIPAGTVHALGAGCLVFEAQQPSEITYRLDDWGRLDSAGKPRPLHLDEGLATYDPASRPAPIAPLSLPTGGGRRHVLSACRHFAVERIALVAGETQTATAVGSPQTVTVVRGRVTVGTSAGHVTLNSGDSTMVAAATSTITVKAVEPTVLLRAWIPDLLADVVTPALAAGHDLQQVSTLAGPLPDIAAVVRDRWLNSG